MKGKTRHIIKIIVVLVIIAIPLLVISYEKNSLSVQNTYLRWDNTGKSSHISVFMSYNAEFKINNVYELEEKVNNILLQSDALNRDGNGRSLADCYSGNGKVTVANDITDMEANAIGVGGDFFLFHPLTLVNGSYFSDDNIMQDLVVIDEDIAWRMFGSSDVSGMSLEINGMNCIISGVIKRGEGRLNKAAENNKPTIYMSYNMLSKSDEKTCITSYEIVMPNLTKDYAKKAVKDSLDIDKRYFDIVDNTERFSLISLCKVITKLDIRSMKTNEIGYPYWENIARATENKCALWLLAEIIILLIISIAIIKSIIKWYNRKSDLIKMQWEQLKVFIKELPEKCINFKSGKENEENMTEEIKEYKGTVIFDIGNVLVKFLPEKFLEDKGYHGEQNKKLINNIINTDIWNEYDKGIINKEELIKKYVERTPWIKEDIEKIFESLEGIVERCDYTDKWIEELKSQNVKVLYLSNISETLYRDCISELDFIEKMYGGILSFQAKCIKPDNIIYEMLIKKYNLIPEKSIFIDDREANIKSAIQAGFNSILFTSYEETNNKIMNIIDKWNNYLRI